MSRTECHEPCPASNAELLGAGRLAHKTNARAECMGPALSAGALIV